MIGRSVLRAALIAFVLACCAPALAQDPQATIVQAAARDWLALTDRGDGAASFDAAAAKFKSSMTRERWIETLAKARGPLGALERRTVLSTSFVNSFPGAPDGDYAIVLFRSSFAKKADGNETVTLEREPDAKWRVVGYFIR